MYLATLIAYFCAIQPVASFSRDTRKCKRNDNGATPGISANVKSPIETG